MNVDEIAPLLETVVLLSVLRLDKIKMNIGTILIKRKNYHQIYKLIREVKKIVVF